MKRFKIHFRDGFTQDIVGTSITNALMKAGYGGGIMSAIDYWEEV